VDYSHLPFRLHLLFNLWVVVIQSFKYCVEFAPSKNQLSRLPEMSVAQSVAGMSCFMTNQERDHPNSKWGSTRQLKPRRHTDTVKRIDSVIDGDSK